jgi:hypothetical protein
MKIFKDYSFLLSAILLPCLLVPGCGVADGEDKLPLENEVEDALVSAIKGELDAGRILVEGLVAGVEEEDPQVILERKYFSCRIEIEIKSIILIEGGKSKHKKELEEVSKARASGRIFLKSVSEIRPQIKKDDRMLFVAARNEQGDFSIILKCSWNEKYAEIFKIKQKD